eukprot:TRINITY_DN2420_c0_g3_i1.p1 TRINITY_DN2420_c0_g3~~TRINITY_DN2420_c0_g3_i1.p1  ORF type:complete len:708 (+),score=252.10 TRINITY_DN2420_c0_g3_i1:57-2180(+)
MHLFRKAPAPVAPKKGPSPADMEKEVYVHIQTFKVNGSVQPAPLHEDLKMITSRIESVQKQIGAMQYMAATYEGGSDVKGASAAKSQVDQLNDELKQYEALKKMISHALQPTSLSSSKRKSVMNPKMRRETIKIALARKALYDYTDPEDSTFSISAGTVATVLDESDAEWTLILSPSNVQGYIPASYLSKQKSSADEGAEEKGDTTTPKEGESAHLSFEVHKALVLFDYTATGPNEMSLTTGEDVTVVSMDDDQWWEGLTDDGREGFFPRAYVELYKNRVAKSNSSESDLLAKVTAKALYAYSGSTSDELSLEEGQIFAVTDRTDKDWWAGELADGQIGFFPSAYVEITAYTPPVFNSSPASPTSPNINSNPVVKKELSKSTSMGTSVATSQNDGTNRTASGNPGLSRSNSSLSNGQKRPSGASFVVTSQALKKETLEELFKKEQEEERLKKEDEEKSKRSATSPSPMTTTSTASATSNTPGRINTVIFNSNNNANQVNNTGRLSASPSYNANQNQNGSPVKQSQDLRARSNTPEQRATIQQSIKTVTSTSATSVKSSRDTVSSQLFEDKETTKKPLSPSGSVSSPPLSSPVSSPSIQKEPSSKSDYENLYAPLSQAIVKFEAALKAKAGTPAPSTGRGGPLPTPGGGGVARGSAIFGGMKAAAASPKPVANTGPTLEEDFAILKNEIMAMKERYERALIDALTSIK